jgi:hypothetical protein
MIRRLFRYIAEYFIFLIGFVFIFVIGAIYSFIQPEGLWANALFLLIALGWVVYIVKQFWDLIDKNRK